MIKVVNLWHTYPNGIEALKGISFTVSLGETVLIIGPNGTGKTTLLKHLNGLLKPTLGDVFIKDINTKKVAPYFLAHYVALSFQNPQNQIFSSSVWKEVAFGPKNLQRPNQEALVESALVLTGLEKFKDFHPYDLHPSKWSFLILASSLAMETECIALDEPTAGMSFQDKKRFEGILKKIKKQGKILIVASHDLDFFFGICERIMTLKDGKLLFDGRKSDLLSRKDAKVFLKEGHLSFPIIPRLGRQMHFQKSVTTPEEFVEEYYKRRPRQP